AEGYGEDSHQSCAQSLELAVVIREDLLVVRGRLRPDVLRVELGRTGNVRELLRPAGERTDVELLAQIRRIVVPKRLGGVLGAQGVVAAGGRAPWRTRAILDLLRQIEEFARHRESPGDKVGRYPMMGDLEEPDLLTRLCHGPSNDISCACGFGQE